MRPRPSSYKNIAGFIETALLHQQKGQFQQAKTLYNKVLVIDPKNFDALHLSGVLAHQIGDNQTAVVMIKMALQQDKANPFAYNNLGEVYRALNHLREAEQCYCNAIKLKPDYFEANNNLGNALNQLGLPEKAILAYQRAISLKPDNPGTYNNLGSALTSLGQLNDAKLAFQQALQLNPNYAEAYNNLGKIFLDQGHREEGLEAYHKAIMLQPDYDEPYYNLGATFQEAGQLAAAEQAFNKALAINPEYASCKWNLSLIMLLQGRFEDGFKLYENRFTGGDPKVFAKMNRILEQLHDHISWHGEPLRGKSLLIIAEQGLGDNLMMMRYFALLKQQNVTRIIVYCEPPLIRLFRHQPGVDDVFSMSDPIPFGTFDLYCSSMSLPYLFQTQLETIPNHVPYIVIPEHVKLQWEKRFANISAIKVGLVWAGKLSYRKDQLRSMSLQQFGPLFDTVGVQFVSLQKGDAAGELKEHERKIIDWIDECDDLLDTAALIDQLDLVISVDTAVAHLAGALGKPVWMLSRSESDWRWQLNRDDSPWYPTMKIFRQREQGVWTDVIDRIARALSDFSKTIITERSESTACDNPRTWFERGVALITEGDLAAAEICFQNTLKLAPYSLEAQLNLGYVLGNEPERYEEALRCYDSVLMMLPDCAEARYNRAVHLLRRGDYINGFSDYEFRFTAMKEIDRRIYTQPLWDGSPLNGRTILVVCEQGLGDAIMFARFIPLLAELGGRVLLEVQQPLVTLLAFLPGVELIIEKTSSLPVTDCYIHLLSIPHLFRTTLESLPCQVPYITVPVHLMTSWRERLAITDGDYRIGLVWACKGRPLPNRTCPPAHLNPLFSLPATRFFSLQVGEKERFPLPKELADQVIDVSNDFKDFTDTAACIMALDLVITVDAAVAHLAGALGKQVWVLLPRHSDWRWLLDRSDSPWYPTMRLFRQQREGDWPGVIDVVKQELAQLFAGAVFHNQHGVELLRQGLTAEAEQAFSMAASLDPDNAEVHCNRGAAQDAQHKYDQALDSYRTAIALRPDYLQAFFNMGNTCRALGNQVAAISCYDQALNLAPDFVPALLCLGQIYKEQHNYARAQEYFAAAIRNEPHNAHAYEGFGDSLRGQDDFTNAILAYNQALAIEPQRASICNKMGLAHHHAGQFSEAEVCFRKALDLAPNYPDILNNLGTLLHSQERINEEVTVYHQLLTLDPTHTEGHWNLSLALLTKGEFVEGWREYEWRFKKMNPVPIRDFPQPRWDGSPLEGKTILLHCEQGFGDTIQFARYAPLVAQRGGNVVLECQSIILKRLLASLAGIKVIVSGDPLPHFDCHLPLLSLPLTFNTTVESIPAPVSYLSPNRDDVETWRRRLEPAKTFRVGIAWFARQDQILNRKRSCPLVEFKPMDAIPNCEFYSLQIGVGVEQLTESNFGRRIIDFTADLHDFADTAALMMNLDLVISIDTVAAHLAGALGVPTWLLLPFGAEWRWLQQRLDSPWYPTMRLFRQPVPGDWQTVMREAQEELQKKISTELPTTVIPILNSPNHYKNIVSVSEPGIATSGRLRVGLAWWTGSQDNLSIRKRSCPFSALSPLLDVPNVTFVNLQLGVPDECDARLIGFSEQIRNFEDTAALMANLDLIISIDTSVAHLAAATGRPTWVLLPHVADWRWLTNCGESLWYPGVKLFWQPDIGDWGSVVREVAFHLAQFPNNRLDSQSIGVLANGCFEERTALELLLKAHRKALYLNVSCPDSHLDFGAALALLGRHEEAVAAFRKVLTLNANHVSGHLNLAYSLLALGEYSEGWQLFEWRLQRIRPGQLPPWPMLQRNELGTHRKGSSLLVHCEQGYGDTIMFSRFLPLLADAGYRVVISCQPPLSSLVASLRDICQVVPHGELLPVCDLQIPMLSLPYVFSKTVETIPTGIPYLFAGNHLKEAWKSNIEQNIAAGSISPKVF